MNFDKMCLADFVQLVTGESNPRLAKAKIIQRARAVSEETDEDWLFLEGLDILKEEFENKRYLQ